MSQIGTISTYESGVDLIVEWKIEHFFTLSQKDGKYYWSPDFTFDSKGWYLEIFPNGWSGSDSSGHVDLVLCKYSDRSLKQSFSLSFKTVKGEKYNEKHFSKYFDDDNLLNRFNRFIPRSELSSRRSELLPEGDLTVICTMKSSSSAGSDSNSGSAEYCLSDSAECSSDSDSGECCHKCSNCLDIVKKQKLLEDLENQKERSEAGKYTEHPFVEAPTQSVDASTQTVEASTQTVEASTQSVEASTQTVEASTQTVETSTQTVEASIETVEDKCGAHVSGSSIGPHDDELRHDLKELFLKKEDCDIIIKVKDSEFPAHRLILKARSPMFASTFRHDMKENTTGVLEIQDCDSSTFSDFLCFLYCGDIGIISQENVFGLFTAADKYQVLELRAKCLEFIKKNITVDTFCETLTLALRHSKTELIKLSTDYFKENIPKIIVTVKWQIFLAENPTESNELLVKCFVPNRS